MTCMLTKYCVLKVKFVTHFVCAIDPSYDRNPVTQSPKWKKVLQMLDTLDNFTTNVNVND